MQVRARMCQRTRNTGAPAHADVGVDAPADVIADAHADSNAAACADARMPRILDVDASAL